MFATFATLAALAPSADPAPKFELKDGDRVVWLGNALVEREQRYGYWETALLAAFPDKNVTFRNLGWSGDTVWGEARAAFDPPAKGFERLVSLTLELKPTVIFVSYGTNESFEGEAGLKKFEDGLNSLLDALKPANARLVLFTPPPFAKALIAQNKALAAPCDTIRTVATARGWYLADFHRCFPGSIPDGSTDNGIHFTREGYSSSANSFLASLGLSAPQKTSELPELAPLVAAKNQLFFYKWRPQNETYLTGFRKHEQGRNAKEIAEFDPLIDAAEKDVRKALAAHKK